MTQNDIPESLRRELNILKLWALGSTLAIGVLLLAAVRSPVTMRLDTLEVERLDILNEGGALALSLAGQGRLPGPTFGGTEYPQELSGGRTSAAGMIFFNERGDEVGVDPGEARGDPNLTAVRAPLAPDSADRDEIAEQPDPRPHRT